MLKIRLSYDRLSFNKKPIPGKDGLYIETGPWTYPSYTVNTPWLHNYGIDIITLEYSSLSTTGLTHWGRVTHICASKLTISGSDNGLSPDRRQAIIWTTARLLLIGPLKTNFSELVSEIHAFLFQKMHLKTPSAKWRPFCLGPHFVKVTDSTIGTPRLLFWSRSD